MTVTEINTAWTVGGLLLFILSLIKIKPLEINAWTWIGRKLGDVLNHSSTEQFNKLSTKIDKLTTKVDEIEIGAIRERAVSARARILRFGDELRLHHKHSKDMFDSILLDVDTYEKYCVKDPDFENNITTATIKLIKEVFDKCLRENDFL